jgi:uncharacterized protein
MDYNQVMEFEWDEAKSAHCFEQRGFDFSYVGSAFFDEDRVIRADQRFEYGEERFQMLGRVDGRLFQVAYTMRGALVRIISARKANSREVKDYEDGTYES